MVALKTSLLILLILILSIPVQAMTSEGCGAGSCNDCHSLTKEEAAGLLEKGGIDKVLNVEFSEMPGVWAVEVEKDRKRFPVYLDFSKSFVIAGNIIRLKDGENVTQRRTAELNRVDVSRIPLDDALLLGSPDAQTKVIVFTDPECPFCKKLHAELKEVVGRRSDIAFLIKLYPLKMHPNAYGISKSIVCTGSMELLELSFAGKPVPPATCETSAVDRTLALAEELGIRSTPTLVLPDGLVMPGYKKADDIIKVLDGAAGK
jgi:thiol:disulfide interchange protein DsbC